MRPVLQPFDRIIRAVRLFAFLLWFIFMSTGFAQTQSAQVTASERSWITAKLYSSIQVYFSHWEAVPHFDLDRNFRK